MDKVNINNIKKEYSKNDNVKAGGVEVVQQPSTSAVKLEPLSPTLQIPIKKEPIESPTTMECVETNTCLSSQQPRECIQQNHPREENAQSANSSSNRAATDTMKVFIRGLVKTDTNIIKRELVALGYLPIDIYPVKVRKVCHYVVTLKTMPNVSWIYKLKRLLSCNIKVEPWCASRDTIQCKKCQQFWHAASNCRRRQVCPRCGGEHKPQNCPRSLQQLRCANCTGPHAASDVKCPIFKGEMQRARQVAAKAKRYLPETSSRITMSQYQPRFNNRRENYTAAATVPVASYSNTHNSKVCFAMVLEILKSIMASLSSGQEAAQQAIVMGLLKYDAWTRMSRSFE